MAKILIVCVARHLANVAPELFEAIQAMILYTLRTPNHKKDTIDLIILTEQPRDSKGNIKSGNQARAWNMNKIRRHAIKNYDYVIKVDSDMVPPAHGIVYLIGTSRKYKVAIVTSLTPERPSKCGTDEFSQLMEWNKNEGKKHIRNRIKKQKPFKCTGNAGEGFMLMKTSALKLVKWPTTKKSGDFAFWNAVHKKGIKVVCSPRVICAHKTNPSKGSDIRVASVLVRGVDWIADYWRRRIMENMVNDHSWHYGLPYEWWYGMSMKRFLKVLPFRLSLLNAQLKEPEWFVYPSEGE